jgi:hypothetical protein
MQCVWSTHIQMHFVPKLAFEGFVLHMLRYISCGTERVSSIQVEIFFVSLRAWDEFGQHMLR